MRKSFLVVLLILFASLPAMAKKVDLKSGDAPPPYVGVGDDRNKLYAENYRGKVVIVTFWASWCVPCLNELPVLNEMQKQIGDDNLKVIAVQFKDRRENFKKMKRVIDDWRLEFALDPSGRVAKSYGVKNIPHMFMIGRDGNIAHTHIGYGEAALDGIVDEINALLLVRPPIAESDDPSGQ